MAFAARLRAAREAAGWSQAELAQAAAVGERTVQRAENGRHVRPAIRAAIVGVLPELAGVVGE